MLGSTPKTLPLVSAWAWVSCLQGKRKTSAFTRLKQKYVTKGECAVCRLPRAMLAWVSSL
eukprot:1161628-Pelagomonas_calceolata.AAC.10